MRAIEVGLKNPYLVAVVVLALIVVGVTTMTRIPADLLPQFNTPAVQIVTFYPGMPPEVMERDIMSRLERWTGQSVGIEHQEAKAMLGVCIVKDFFREGISLDTCQLSLDGIDNLKGVGSWLSIDRYVNLAAAVDSYDIALNLM